MIDPALLPPLPVAGPLLVAALLLAVAHHLPARVPDAVAIATALAACVCCAVMAKAAAGGPLVYWFGGWQPRDGLVLGIGFSVDQAGATIAAFIGLLFVASLVFAWSYFDDVHAHFHVLMLLFMAGMIGFCLTHDLFNLFVWFELMSVTGFALTGYALSSSALEGALNFTVVNTIGAYLILGGIGLIYARTGALDFSAIARAVAAQPQDAVVLGAFALLATGLLTKAAQVPFHFWLSDAHTVAPSPVSVIFSGAMVSLGLFGVARLLWPVFSASGPIHETARTLLVGMGAASAVVGGGMALLQRHIKRLLAFSTISHAGIMLIGLALLDRDGLAGMLTYLVGHGLVKGALFMLAGILLALAGGVDEIGLRGKGRPLWPAGIAMAAAGLLLGGLPVGLMDEGVIAIAGAAPAWAVAAILFGTASTGGAVLRVAGRVFLGWGSIPGLEEGAPTEDERERADRPFWLMLTPALLLLALGLPASEAAGAFARHAADAMTAGDVGAAASHPAAWLGWTSTGLSVVIALLSLARGVLGRPLKTAFRAVTGPAARAVQSVHSGLVGDYVTWAVVGLAVVALWLGLW